MLCVCALFELFGVIDVVLCAGVMAASPVATTNEFAFLFVDFALFVVIAAPCVGVLVGSMAVTTNEFVLVFVGMCRAYLLP